jgi:immune inhibitor A
MFKFSGLAVLVLFAGMMGGVVATQAEAVPEGPCFMPAHPDLIQELGPKVVAERQARFHSRQMASDLRIHRDKSGASRVTGTGTCLFILFEFSDHPADKVNHPASAYQDLFFSEGVFPTGSLNDYYQEVSYGAFSIDGHSTGWTLAQNSYASYANTDGSQDAWTAREMIIDAVAQLDPIIDFSLYDNDGPDGIPSSGDDDGLVDALFFLHAGPGQEMTGDTNDIWSHAWSFWDGLPTNDGVAIGRYSVEPEELDSGELMTLGVFAHEYGHVLGLPDLYDTDYSTSGIGEWGLMSGGSWTHRDGDLPGSSPTHPTAWSKQELGWLDPIVVTSDLLNEVIPPAATNPVAYRVFRAGDTFGDEYFLLENRRPLGFDEGLVRRQYSFGLAAPQGLAIYHVDESVSGNSNDQHRLVDVVDASPWFNEDGTWHENLDGPRDYELWQHVSAFNRGDNGDLWPGFTAFTADTTDWVSPRDRDVFSDFTVPAAWDYECNNTGVVIGNITDDGTNVTADIIIQPAAKGESEAVRADRTWDFETGVEDWLFCNSFVHRDELHGDGCTGTGGLWFGLDRDDWFCPGYGNNWSDFTWVTVAVETGSSPQIILDHKYDLEPAYDFGYLEVRPAGDLDWGWTELAVFNGVSGCTNNSYAIPQQVLNAGDEGGVSWVDVRLHMTSDGGWSAEDGSYCGIGWWIDAVTVTQMAVTPVGDLPAAGNVAHLDVPSPNPFNPATVLRFHVPSGARQVRLQVYDQRGRLVRELDAVPTSGWQEARWDGRDSSGSRTASGLYFARLTVDGVSQVQKMALVK